MWLFDELLKKPPQTGGDTGSAPTWGQPQGTGQSQGDDSTAQSQPVQEPVFKIEKTEEQQISTEAKVLPSTPEAPAVVAEEDASDILVSWDSALPQDNQPIDSLQTAQSEDTLVEQNEAPETIPSADLAPSDILSEAPSEESHGTDEAAQDALNQDILALHAQEDSIQESSTDPVQATQTDPIQESPLFNFGLPDTPTTEQSTEAEPTVEQTIEEESTVEQATEAEPTVEPAIEEESMNFSPAEVVQANTNPGNLTAYIKNNIQQSDVLIAKLDTTHTAKLEEAAGYKSEKERFSQLEEDAYADAERMMVEKAHTERMKAYFVEQLDQANNAAAKKIDGKKESSAADAPDFREEKEPVYDEPPALDDVTLVDDDSHCITGSMETALTGIAVQESVKSTVEKKHKTKKVGEKEKKEETFSLI